MIAIALAKDTSMFSRHAPLVLALMISCQSIEATDRGNDLDRAQSALEAVGRVELGGAVLRADSSRRMSDSIELTGVRLMVDGTDLHAEQGALSISGEDWSLVLEKAESSSEDGQNTITVDRLTMLWPRKGS